MVCRRAEQHLDAGGADAAVAQAQVAQPGQVSGAGQGGGPLGEERAAGQLQRGQVAQVAGLGDQPAQARPEGVVAGQVE
jgi:hypothetical protein